MKELWVRIAMLFFFIAGCIGALLRWAFVAEVDWIEFRYFMHAHSHIAMLGWVFLMLYTFLIHSFLKEKQKNKKSYNILFGLFVLSCVGMLFFFPIQGYALGSIFFSTMHILLSYIFVWLLLKDLPRQNQNNQVSIRFLKTALIFMIISTFALWMMGPLMTSEYRGSALYYAAVQFYLHFQFNGWFVFAILALFFKLLEDKKIFLPVRLIRWFYYLLVLSCCLTYALAVAWSNPLAIIFWINSAGVGLQLLALISFTLVLRKIRLDLNSIFKGTTQLLIGIALVCFVLKIIMQSAVIIPSMATVAYTIRNFVIGFIHLILLGIISHFIFGFAKFSGLLDFQNKLSKFGLILFISSFFLTEFTLFFQGLLLWTAYGFLPYYYEGLFVLSAILPLSILAILLGETIDFKKSQPSMSQT